MTKRALNSGKVKFDSYLKCMLFGFGIVVTMDWRLDLLPAANNVMAPFSSLYTISSYTLPVWIFCPLTKTMAGFDFACMHVHVFCIVVWANPTWLCLNGVG